MSDDSQCTLCPRMCQVKREKQELGFCRMPKKITVSRAALHMWEEPCISGEEGSGAVFFSGCNLQCVYCQNKKIASGEVGIEISIEKLAEIFLNLQEKQANNMFLILVAVLLVERDNLVDFKQPLRAGRGSFRSEGGEVVGRCYRLTVG